MIELKSCPFCGGEAYLDQHGTTRQSCVISCHTCGCMLETNEEGANCGDQWNRRASAPAADQEAYEQECLNMTAEGIKYWKDKYEALVAASAPAAGSVPSDHDIEMLATGFAIQHRNGLLKFARALLAQYGSPAWQPIETAPKGVNGISFMGLAWGPDDDRSTGAGMQIDGKFYAAGTFFCAGSKEKPFEIRECEVKPTHWMPLPPAPQEGK